MKKRKLLVSILAGLMAAVMLLSLIIGILPRRASAATSGELKEQLDELLQQQDAISQQLDALRQQQSENLSDIAAVVRQKDIIDQQVALLYAEVNNINAQISAYSLLIADKQAELDIAQRRLDELNEKYKDRIRAMEEEGELSYWSVLFKANSFSDLLDRLNMMTEIAAADQRRLDEMSAMAEQVALAQQELTAEKAQLEVSKAELETAQAELDDKSARADALLLELTAKAENLEDLHNQFEQEESDFLLQIAQKEQEYNKQVAAEEEASRQASIRASIEASIEASIQASIRESIEASIAESIAESIEASIEASIQASIDESVAESIRQDQLTATTEDEDWDDSDSDTKWRVPVDYTYFSSPFGYRIHPVTGKWTMHYGVDLAAPKGTPIYASRSGVITTATWSDTAGNYVTINHEDGYSSIYMHMTHYVVSSGDYVKAGQLIGYVGSTGRSTGPHLHFGIAYEGTYVNPADYIDI